MQLAAICMAIGFAAAAPAPHGGKYTGKPLACGDGQQHKAKRLDIQVGPRPYYLIDNMDEGPLKEKLESCKEKKKSTSSFSVSHRGAPLMFPEHSKQGYEAAIRMGAGQYFPDSPCNSSKICS